MTILVWTIIGIVAAASLFAAGQGYVNLDSTVRREARDRVVFAFHSMIDAYNDYYTANQTPPLVASWQSQLVPNYTSMPIPLGGMSWSFANDATYGDYFCLSGNVNKAQNDGINLITSTNSSTHFPASIFVIAYNACGKRSTDALGSAPVSWPGAIYVTYWLAGS